MSLTESTKRQNASLIRDVLSAGRYYLGNRRALLIVAVVVIVAGLALNWNWLVAIGLAPILISTLPCLVMCAFGACMMCKANKEQSTATRTQQAQQGGSAPGVVGATRGASGPAGCCAHEPGEAPVAELNQPQTRETRRDSHA